MAKPRGMTRRIVALPKHLILAGKNAFREGMKTATSVVSRSINGVVHMGNSTAKHVNIGIDETFGKDRKGMRKSKKTRKMRH